MNWKKILLISSVVGIGYLLLTRGKARAAVIPVKQRMAEFEEKIKALTQKVTEKKRPEIIEKVYKIQPTPTERPKRICKKVKFGTISPLPPKVFPALVMKPKIITKTITICGDDIEEIKTKAEQRKKSIFPDIPSKFIGWEFVE